MSHVRELISHVAVVFLEALLVPVIKLRAVVCHTNKSPILAMFVLFIATGPPPKHNTAIVMSLVMSTPALLS